MSDADGSLSLVTVFFEAEVGLLALQARSLALYQREGQFEQIIVIDNTHSGISRRTQRRIEDEFGAWRDRVRIVRPECLLSVSPGRVPGWEAQQVLKLMVHRIITTKHYLVLDAKNQWIQPTSHDTFVAPDGRVRGASHSYRGHALEQRVAGVMRYLHIDPNDWLDHFMVTHTPVLLTTAVVAELIDGIEHRSGSSFAEEFSRARLLEFPLYAAWIIARHGNLDEHIDGSTVRSTTIWPSSSPAEIEAALKGLDHVDSPFLGVHRRALARAGLGTSLALARFWTQRRLFTSVFGALRFIWLFKLSYLRTMSVRKIRSKAGPIWRGLSRSRRSEQKGTSLWDSPSSSSTTDHMS